MNVTKILTIVFYLVSIGLAYFLVSGIAHDIEQEKVIKTVEAKVIDKLMQIREAQEAYRVCQWRVYQRLGQVGQFCGYRGSLHY